jgi:hypothetical protein
MKSILYVGATLMIGASIYGFVDYKKTRQKKEFTRMYEAPEEKEAVVVTETKIEPAVVAEPAVVVTKKTVAREKTGALKSKVEISAAEKMETAPVLVTTSVKETTSAKKFKQAKKKKLDYRLFSRARPREIPEIIAEPVKVETKTAEIKEQ